MVETYGEEGKERFGGELMSFLGQRVDELPTDTSRSAGLEPAAEAVLVAIPDDLFIYAVELGRQYAAGFATDRSQSALQYLRQFEAEVTELFVANGTPYEFENGRLVPTMSPAVIGAAIHPALDALDDSRLSNARNHFQEGLRRLQEPDADKAVDETRQAVEAAMLAVIDAHVGATRPDRNQPQDLFNALVEGTTGVERTAEELVLAAPRFRGRTSAGHAGGATVTIEEARAAVASGAASLLYLASKLP
jgi:hypothetical protein